MTKRRIGSHDLDTGEPVEGVAVWFGRKVVSPYRRQWMQMNQEALAEIAADPDIGAEALRVFLYLNSRLDFENLILVPQVEIATALRMKQPSVSRAIKLLVTKQIIERPKNKNARRLSIYRLNEHYGWKGKVSNLHKVSQERQRHLALVKSNEQNTDPDTGDDTPEAGTDQ